MDRKVIRTSLLALLFMLWIPGLLVTAAELPEVMFILDGSGSMWGQAGGQTKIEAARAVMAVSCRNCPKGSTPAPPCTATGARVTAPISKR